MAQYIQIPVPVKPSAPPPTQTIAVPIYVPRPDVEAGKPKDTKPITFIQQHNHPTQHHVTVVQHTPPKGVCASSGWICLGLFGFLFILLLLGVSSSGDCVSSDNWLFCDNHLHTHHDEDHDHMHGMALLLFGFIAVGGIAACWWFSDRSSRC